MLPPHLCQPLTILCSGFEICLPFSLEAYYFVLKVGALIGNFVDYLTSSNTLIQNSKVALLISLDRHGSATRHESGL